MRQSPEDVPLPFFPTRCEAFDRLAAFVPRAGRAYAETRNADLGPDARENVSVLSPYLRYRLIAEHDVVAAVLAEHKGPIADKFVQEVLWRTYWKGWLELRPDVWTRLQDGLAVEPTGGMATAIARAEVGATGIEGFDDWARELVEHNYLHNHARMWFASIWIFTLGLPWDRGADFFQRHLVDADPASNTLSWRWVAGLQTPGKTYLATSDNIARYTDGRFAPRGLATSARPVTEAQPVPKPRALPAVAPHDRSVPALLLMTGEDLCAEALFVGYAIRHVVGIDGTHDWPWSEPARDFVRGGVADAVARGTARLACEGTQLPMLDADALIVAAQGTGARTIVTAYAPVGPMADALEGVTPTLAAAGVPLVQVRRSWDTRAWPHATKGFFPFRERIPELLHAEGLR